MRIDAHQHYWNIERGNLGWLEEGTILYRSYLPNDLKLSLNKHGIEASIVVQAEPKHEETDFLLSLAEANLSIAGVVGWLDLKSPNYKDVYERFKRNPKFVGFRVMIQEMADPNEVLTPSYIEALTYFAEQKQPLDLLMRASQLDAVVRLLEKVPHLHAVIDHIGKPQIAAGELEPWKEQLRIIASYPNVYCKLSGMVTEADHSQWEQKQFAPYVQHAIECFGSKRIMFGSDWPVCLLAATYDQCMEVLESALPEAYGTDEREALFGGNAARFYQL
ncbi:L-fuconolactonase [Paenibacillus cellulosilyticus]|uniref:L-fuconolactonase n=1 Tax=Paenibacillus cellulosilyticus TaxID=375489 RepID=A0A2V2YYD6_9BACL|nr:amidohydrolase family protein [Paenibacillus cellulosilyticus]PWW07150.1 L-fuconolactonase [Paenibacillus cellulosilyticus]QKS44643.1 amidohydrolase family protein [Paenibacillus cellulosilyticus]